MLPTIDDLVEHCVAAKVRLQTLDGYSPLQWWFGPQCAREFEEHGLGETRSNVERRLELQTTAQTALVRADARKTLRMAQYARSRVLRNPTIGQLVRYFRRSKGGVGGRDRGLGGKMVLLGPARVLVVKQPTEVESQVAAVVWLAHGGSAWNLLVCRKNNGKKVGVDVNYPVTADMFENPEDDWLATASSRARARAEVNIKKLSADERAQFRAAQDKEMDQWISNDVISVC